MTNQGDVAPRALHSMRDGFWVGALNPKAIVFYAAVLPQFIDRDKGHITAQLILLGAIFSTLAFISDGSWGLLAGTARAWLAKDANRLVKLRATGGIIMCLLGLSVLFLAIVSS
jgi:threonine/homoserine/homoserine lactone efflux protein